MKYVMDSDWEALQLNQLTQKMNWTRLYGMLWFLFSVLLDHSHLNGQKPNNSQFSLVPGQKSIQIKPNQMLYQDIINVNGTSIILM